MFSRRAGASTFILKTGQKVRISTEDEALVSRYSWFADVRSPTLSYVRGRLRTQNRRDPYVYLHRLVLSTSKTVDHKDGDGLNNTRENLRPATQREQTFNKRGRASVSKYTGVYLYVDRRGRGKGGTNIEYWVARVTKDGRCVHQTYHKDEKEAARSYDTAALHHFGEFARPNFPQT